MTTTNAAAPSTIRCDQLSIEYSGGVRAVEDVTISAVAGEILALVGPSGCGKTTLLRLMAGLESPTSGQVTLRPPASGVHGEIAFVFQQPTLLPWRTALENVTLPLELISRGSRADRRAAATDLLARVGLSDAMHRFPNQLSGGMKMRVSIARALVTGPSVLLLDEPFAALDDMLRTQLGELLLQLWDERRFTAVMVTHNIGESIVLSHRIAVMRAGRVIETLDSPLPFPRSDDVRSAPEFARFYGKISASLRGNA
ncbi:ABC transporter ATP-binding protein [Rubripirellula reticaptiva]|uniref:ABC transporter ATP-binding protein n=1 Tax=Rubripirellula reticaptiva TaxID=2528013 RepID=UPI0011B510E1|nr:ABC transporter ATP-binding protein [Rubripirellula reticaptiva]